MILIPAPPHAPRRALVLIVQLDFNFLHALVITAHLLESRLSRQERAHTSVPMYHEFPHPERRLVFALRGMDELLPDWGSADGEAAADRTQPMDQKKQKKDGRREERGI